MLDHGGQIGPNEPARQGSSGAMEGNNSSTSSGNTSNGLSPSEQADFQQALENSRNGVGTDREPVYRSESPSGGDRTLNYGGPAASSGLVAGLLLSSNLNQDKMSKAYAKLKVDFNALWDRTIASSFKSDDRLEFGAVILNDGNGGYKLATITTGNEHSVTNLIDAIFKAIQNGEYKLSDIAGIVHTHPNSSFFSQGLGDLETFAGLTDLPPAPDNHLNWTGSLLGNGSMLFVIGAKGAYGYTITDKKAYNDNFLSDVRYIFQHGINLNTSNQYNNVSNANQYYHGIIFKFYKK